MANFSVWDATHMEYVGAVSQADGGYFYEMNHAFYPFLPMIMRTIGMELGDPKYTYVGPIFQVIQSWLVLILLYRCCCLIFKDERTAELSGYIFVLNHSMMYYISNYSEGTFILFTLIGLYSIYSGKQSKSCEGARSYFLPQTHRVMFACFMFGCATLTRSTGVFLSIFVAFHMGNKINPLPSF